MRTFRQDFVEVRSSKIDAKGILRCGGTIARVGVQDYYKDGKIVRELRSHEEVAKSAKGFSKQIVTLDHPREMVTAKNAKDYSIGFSGEANYKDGLIEAELIITEDSAVNAALESHKQISCGYYANLVEESGIWVDEYGVMGEVGKSYEYDAKQTDIVADHIALVQKGRAGDIAMLHTDSRDAYSVRLDSENSLDNIIGNNMVNIVYNDKVYTIDGNDAAQVADIVGSLKTELSAVSAKVSEAESKLDSLTQENEQLAKDKGALEGEKDALCVKLDSLEESAAKSEIKTDAEVIATEIQSRLDIWGEVLPVLKKDAADFEADYSLPVSDIQKMYLKQAAPQLAEKIDSAESSYLEPLWDYLRPANQAKEEKVDSTESLKEAIADTASVQTPRVINRARPLPGLNK